MYFFLLILAHFLNCWNMDYIMVKNLLMQMFVLLVVTIPIGTQDLLSMLKGFEIYYLTYTVPSATNF